MANEYILLNMDDEKSAKVAEVMGNKSCKKILSILAEQELTETDISNKINLPLNTTEYNLKKLIQSGLVEKAKTHFWSVKGKKIPVYKLANKYIVIAPKSSSKSVLKSFLPVVLVSGVIALMIRYLFSYNSNSLVKSTNDFVLTAPQVSGASAVAETASVSASLMDKILSLPSWEWFLAGALFAALLFLILTIVRRSK